MGLAMELFRLRIKIGEHEFEAEGEQESVERQFALWRDLVSAAPSTPPTLPSPPPGNGGNPPPIPETSPQLGDRQAIYDKIFRRDGPVVALSVIPNGDNQEADTALLILLGQKVYNQEDQVTGGRLKAGLEHTGLTVARPDRMFGDYMGRNVIRSGQHRAVRYRLTIPGMARAQELAEELSKMVP
jgi:hypothetical protein